MKSKYRIGKYPHNFKTNKVIIKSGHTMFLKDVLEDLRRLERLEKDVQGMICSDCGRFNCDCDWYVLNRKNIKLKNKIKELER